MSIPLYLAYNPKDSVSNFQTPAAQCGFGFFADGTARVPNRRIPAALPVIDDAMLPEQLLPGTLEALAEHCADGCLFDFERRSLPIHAKILLGLAALLTDAPLFAVPERFLTQYPRALPIVKQPRQGASWADFVCRAQARFPGGWMLEVVPAAYSANMPFAGTRSGYLKSAVCRFRQNGACIRYYDTAQTLQTKLALAAQHGCRAAIGLYCELSALEAEGKETLDFFRGR